MSTVLEILERTAVKLQAHAEQTGTALADGPTLDALRQAEQYYIEQIGEAQRSLDATRHRIAARTAAEAADVLARAAAGEAVELLQRHRQALTPPPAEEVIAAGLTPPRPFPAAGPEVDGQGVAGQATLQTRTDTPAGGGDAPQARFHRGDPIGGDGDA